MRAVSAARQVTGVSNWPGGQAMSPAAARTESAADTGARDEPTSAATAKAPASARRIRTEVVMRSTTLGSQRISDAPEGGNKRGEGAHRRLAQHGVAVAAVEVDEVVDELIVADAVAPLDAGVARD